MARYLQLYRLWWSLTRVKQSSDKTYTQIISTQPLIARGLCAVVCRQSSTRHIHLAWS